MPLPAHPPDSSNLFCFFVSPRSFSPRRQHYVIALEIVAEISPLHMTSALYL
jgi:hypothetical protein